MYAYAFKTLPTEPVWLVMSLLDQQDLMSLRLVCHDTDTKTFGFFASRFLKSISTNLKAHDLARLNALCKGKRACPYVQRLAFYARGSNDRLGPYWDKDIFWDSRLHLQSPLKAAPVKTLRDNLLHDLVNCRSFSIAYHRAYSPADRLLGVLPLGACIYVFLAIIADTRIPVTSFQFFDHHASGMALNDVIQVSKQRPEIDRMAAT